MQYTGKLADGKVFDSGDISFHFGKGQVARPPPLRRAPPAAPWVNRAPWVAPGGR